MRRIFTFSFIAAVLLLASFNSFGQCTTTTNFTAASTYDFNTAASGNMGFTGDFSRVNNAGGQLSATVGATSPTTKTLVSPTFLAPNSISNIQFSFDLGGNATVSGYTIQFLYDNNGTITSVNGCSATVAMVNGTYIFSVAAPAEIVGQRFKIRVILDVSGNSNNTVTIDNFRANVGASNIPLPVKFQTFEATSSSNSVSLKWVVATEENVSGYEVEKSVDGRSFSKIGFVSANNQSTYTFVDTKSSATTYYRIRSIDIDGKYAFSTIAILKAGQSMIMLNAFPSPFTNSFSLDHGTATSGSLITVSGQDGREIKTIIPSVGSQRTFVDLSTAKAGMYLVRYKSSNGEVGTLKILKQ